MAADTDLRRELLSVTESDLVELAAWVPPAVSEMQRVLGVSLSTRLLSLFPGAMLRVPLAASVNQRGAARRARLEEMLGADDAARLCQAWGGELLVLPVMRSLLAEKRRRWLAAAVAQLTAEPEPALSTTEAVYETGLRLTAAGLPMTARQIYGVLERQVKPVDRSQIDLFSQP